MPTLLSPVPPPDEVSVPPAPHRRSSGRIHPPALPPVALPNDGIDGNVVIQFLRAADGSVQQVVYIALLNLQADTVRWDSYTIENEVQKHSIFGIVESCSRSHAGWGVSGNTFYLEAKVSPGSRSASAKSTGRTVHTFCQHLRTKPFHTYAQKVKIAAIEIKQRKHARALKKGSQGGSSSTT